MSKKLLFFICCCLTAIYASAQTAQSQVPLADPYILLDGDTYYAYGTNNANGIEYWKSSDLQNWVYGGLALSKANTTEKQWFWAPEVYFKKPIMNIEMHKRIVRDKTDYYDRIWERVVPQETSAHAFTMTPEDFYLYMIAHFYKHFTGGGTGVRYVCDTEVYLRAYGDAMDRAAVDAQLEKSGYLDFERQIRALCGVWFHDEPTDDALTAFSEKMLFCGVFGTPERAADNAMRAAVQQMPGKNVHSKRLLYLLTLLFPPLSVMRDVFPVLQRLPFLLPVFWIVRGIKRLFTGNDNIKQLMQRAEDVTEDDLKRNY